MTEKIENSYIDGWKSLLEHPLIKDFEFRDLLKNFSCFRNIKRDGNCFYYTFLSQLVEYLRALEDKGYINFERSLVDFNKEYEKIKKEKVIYKDFYEVFLKVIRECRNNSFDIQNASDFDILGAITYIKVLIVTELMSKKSAYEPFLVDIKIEQYCQENIEPLFKETEHLEIQALSNLLKIGVNVFSVRKSGCEKTHFGNEKKFVSMLHTPNHFEPIK